MARAFCLSLFAATAGAQESRVVWIWRDQPAWSQQEASSRPDAADPRATL